MQDNLVAFCYDFDKTLSPQDMQEFTLIPRLGFKKPSDFWEIANSYSTNNNIDRILGSLFAVYLEAKKQNVKLTKQFLKDQGPYVKYFEGVETWFEDINAYGKSIGLEIEHYVISAGMKEIIQGTSIAKYFKNIYASSYLYDDETKEALWPRQVVNETMKTQVLYRINKGVLRQNDSRVNSYIPKEDRRIKFENIVYIGDSDTDIPSMSVIREKGGYAIGVYNPSDESKGKVMPLIRDNRINFFAPADYRKDSELYQIIIKCLDKIKINYEVNEITKRQKIRINEN